MLIILLFRFTGLEISKDWTNRRQGETRRDMTTRREDEDLISGLHVLYVHVSDLHVHGYRTYILDILDINHRI